MFPMISTLMELRQAKMVLADVMDELHTARTLTFDDLGSGIVVMSVNRPDRANSQTVEMFGEIAWATATLRNAPLRRAAVRGDQDRERGAPRPRRRGGQRSGG